MFAQNIKRITLTATVFLAVFLFSKQADAHSGRTDSSGGHNCYTGSCAGTYHYHNGGYYIPPTYYAPPCTKPQIGNSGSPTFKGNGCNQDVIFNWDKGYLDSSYSIKLSRVAGADPGPLADTKENTYTFKNVVGGTWYVNLKAGNSCGWSDIYYWKINVPETKYPIIESFREETISERMREITYSIPCADKVEITPEIGLVKIPKGSIYIYPNKNTTYTLTATYKKQTSSRNIFVRYPLPKESKTIEDAKNNDTETEENDSLETILKAGLLLSVVGGAVWLSKKSGYNKEV